jgi:hypothetical protein
MHRFRVQALQDPPLCSSTVFLLYTAPQKLNTVKSLRERTAQNARSFKLSDRFERCANSFFDNSLIVLHSFSFAQKIKDHSSLLSVCSIYKSDVPSSGEMAPSTGWRQFPALPSAPAVEPRVHIIDQHTNFQFGTFLIINGKI